MANPIQKTDLISDEALKALEEMSRLLREDKENMDALMASFKQYAGSIQPAVAANNSNNDALAAALQKVSELEKAYSDLQKAMKENAATQKAINAEKRKYAKLTKEEATEVKNLRTELKWLNDEDKEVSSYVKKKIEAINAEKMSYNQLQQTYNAVRDALNKMTPEQLKSTEAGKLLAAQGLKIRDAMNEMQKATGNYTLQVGKYRAAFDGLGYSFQQILREAPSALNLNQFFLAISNNIPMFTDQLKAFKDEQKEIAENLKTMTEGTEEYAEQQAKQMTVGQKLAKTLISWQTAILVGLMLIRNYGEDIIKWIGNVFTGTKKADDAAKQFEMTMRDINREASNSIANTKAELDILMDRLSDVSKGTDEWRKIIERVNEITGSTLDYQKAMPDEIRKVTKAYLDQILTIEKNQQIAERLAKSQMARNLVTNSIGRVQGVLENDKYSAEDIVRMMGLDPKEQDELINGILFYRKFYQNSNDSEGAEFLAELIKRSLDATGALPKDVEDWLAGEYETIGAYNTKGKKTPKNKTPNENDIDYRLRDYIEARIELTKIGYEREIALSGNMLERENDQLVDWRDKQLKSLEENLKNGFISQAEYKEREKELNDTYDMLFEKAAEDHRKRINSINTKYAEMDRQVVVEEELGWIEELDEAYKVADNNRRRRIKTIKDEEISNRNITESIIKMREEIEKLQEKNLTQPEAIEQRTKRIQELEKAIAKLQTQIDHTKQLSTYSSVGDIFRRNVSVGAGTQQSLMESILGTDAYSAFTPGSKEMQDAIEKDFETWMQSVEKTATEWYNTTMGYINDLISAYVELANAKAEAAKEATKAAQEEYDKEKALLEAGYASRVEATWAEYQEKKAAQEKAEEDAKAAAKAQQEINNLSTMGSLITAAANIWKTFTEIPVVGIPLAIAATGTMFGAFLAAKIKANEVSKYGEGGFEVLEGGSHASGHDIDLGVRNRRGRRMKAEGKEGIGIFSVRAMNHYGDRNIEGFVNSINRLEFEGNAAKRMSIERSVGMAVLSAPRTDLHRVENSLDKLVSYGSRSRYTEADGTVVEVRKSGVVRYRK